MAEVTIFPGVDVQVLTPSSMLEAPWLLISGESVPWTLSSPLLTRESEAAFRAIADQIKAAWAELDRRAGIATPEEDQALDELEQRASHAEACFAPRIDTEV